MTDNFPRLLVATEFPPNASGGGGAIVRQMLKGWPVENLFWWSSLPETSRHFGQSVAAHSLARIPQKLFPHRRYRRQKSWLLENFWTPWAARHFRKTLETLKPGAVWVIPHGWAILPLAQILPAAKIGFNVSIHDYMDHKDSVAGYGAERSRRLAKLAEQLYASATTRDAICQIMADDLQAQTGRGATQILHAGLEREDFNYLSAKTDGAAGQIRIAYAGTISVEPSFILFVEALSAIRARLPKPVSIEIFSSHSYRDRKWFDASWMHERGNLPEPQFTNALRECAWGFSPMSLAEDDPRHRFSLSTKFISYLAAGLPVLTLGHPECGVVKMAQAYRVGECVTSGDPENLRQRLFAALSVEKPWQEFGAEILRCAHDECDAARSRQKLYDCFRLCAEKTSAMSNNASRT
jgi:hypothetical protein